MLYFLKKLIITFVTSSLAGVDRLGALSVDLLFLSPSYYNGGYFVSAQNCGSNGHNRDSTVSVCGNFCGLNRDEMV